MAAPMKTPGVYIVEKSAFPNSVVEVATAVPAFIGYTEKADNKGKSLVNKPWKISSMAEFHNYFGGGCNPVFSIGTDKPEGVDEADFLQRPAGDDEADPQEYFISQTAGKYYMYNSMKLFFSNGGGPCYIVSVGKYGKEAAEQKIESADLNKGIESLIKEQEPTMVVIPDICAMADQNEAYGVQQQMLMHCGDKMRNRVSVLDIFEGYKDISSDADECPIKRARNSLGTSNLDFGMAYYPWVNTTIVQDSELDYRNFDEAGRTALKTILKTDLGLPDSPEDNTKEKEMAGQVDGLDKVSKDQWQDAEGNQLDDDAVAVNMRLLQSSLVGNSAAFKIIMDASKAKLNLLPPSAAMAGIFTRVDNASGVWKAPANVSLNAVISPAVNITNEDQQDLNVTPQGKSINAIRSFIGEGTLVWGARTLDGNSLDWRYIQVRRTMIMLEESIKLAAKAYVFENNTANTWITIKSMIRNFLTGIWKRGGLAGSSPDDAFQVMVGLGETMTPEDILEGILRVTVLVALIRPAEFIEITFQQQMQKS